MIVVDATADAVRQRRRTWMTGGVLFLVSALLGLARVSVPGLPFGISQLLFHAGAVVFAVGLGRGGSVTARRPLGTGAIIALAVWAQVGSPVLWALVNSGAPADGVDDSYLASAAMVGTSGRSGLRFSELTPSGRNKPPFTGGNAVLSVSNITWMLPDIRSVSAGPAPL